MEKIMNKKFFLIFALIILLNLTGCANFTPIQIGGYGEAAKQNTDVEISEKLEEPSPSIIADFYDNTGNRYLSVSGKKFKIDPNKIQTYSYDTSGKWISSYEMSSIMSIDIDGHKIESCGSTILFADSRLEKCDIDFSRVIYTSDSFDEELDPRISSPADIRAEDWLTIRLWWSQKSLNNKRRSKAVIIQSQLGNPICMYMGKDVRWDIPRNLPKTTRIKIDDKSLYIHRANFAIIDTDLIN